MINNNLSTVHNKKNKIMDRTLFFLIGLYIPSIIFGFIPIWFFYKIFLERKIKSTIKKSFLFVFLAFFIYFILMSFNMDLLYMSNPYTVIPFYILIFLLTGFLLTQHDNIGRKKCLTAFSLGILSSVYTVLIYNYFFIGQPSLYGELYNPMTSSYVNSPGWSLMLVMVSCYFTGLIIYIKNPLYKLATTLQIISALFFAAYLGGRAFFIIYLFFIVFFLFFLFKNKNLINLLGYFIFFILLLSFVYYFISNYFTNILTIISYRFEQGISSPRFNLWIDGFDKMLKNPFGRFYVDTNIDNVKYFHNFWLDTARISGWFPTIIMISLNIYVLAKGYQKKEHTFNILYLLMNIICLIIMMQDVILEALWRILLFYYITCICLLSNNSKITKTQTRFSLY